MTQRRAEQKKDDEEWDLAMEGRLNNLAPISDFVTAAAHEAGLDDQAAFAVQMATDEACCNIIEHAYDGIEKGKIQIRCRLDGDDFVVKLKDFGRPFNPDEVPLPDLVGDLSKRRIGGLGLHFIRRLMVEVYFSFDETEGNELTMIKRGVAHKVEEAKKQATEEVDAAQKQAAARIEDALQRAARKIGRARKRAANKRSHSLK
ncbi:MAG: ATP-binding protein [Anaerolineae bacterium]|nr:ATP-binding protein [Anaerolineae bacterium]